jgi:hypothetical protein
VFDILIEYPPDFYAIELIALTPFCKGYKILNKTIFTSVTVQLRGVRED